MLYESQLHFLSHFKLNSYRYQHHQATSEKVPTRDKYIDFTFFLVPRSFNRNINSLKEIRERFLSKVFMETIIIIRLD